MTTSPMSTMPLSNMPITPQMASPFPPQMTTPFTAGAAQQPPSVPSGAFVTPAGGTFMTPAAEESYVENILRLNRGKIATFYMTYENNREWNAKIFRGVIEAAGRDHIIISDPSTGMRFLLLTLNLDYVTFEGPINYQYPFQGATITQATPITTAAGAAAPGTLTMGRQQEEVTV
jgi:spore germination protein Q